LKPEVLLHVQPKSAPAICQQLIQGKAGQVVPAEVVAFFARDRSARPGAPYPLDDFGCPGDRGNTDLSLAFRSKRWT
jgi:hypothetical protein